MRERATLGRPQGFEAQARAVSKPRAATADRGMVYMAYTVKMIVYGYVLPSSTPTVTCLHSPQAATVNASKVIAD